ncbi:MAG: alpha-N-arabinofuranosidase [Acidobacteria bacterium]|nr:alpha-N-arabinofuranosidase [Acidobacteriota bacterium]
MTRRAFLSAAPAFVTFGQSGGAGVSIELRPQEAGAGISPHLYGHFIEHLGGVIYGGVWVGRQSKIPNVNGLRKTFIDDMKRIQAPNLRWPGGCFADGYHWRDGVGAPHERPRTYNFWHPRVPKGFNDTETNQFGTHEFLELCERIGCEPYLAANVGTGTPREWYDWIQYCNAPEGTVSQAAERAANGRARPFNVRFWGVGNESWGCGGFFRPQEYANEYRRFVSQLPRYNDMFLIAAGPSGGDLNWTRGFLETMPPSFYRGRVPMHGWALHYYTSFRESNNRSKEFSAEHWNAVIENGRRIENLIESHWKIMGEHDKEHRIKLVIDEWGTWYPTGDEVRPEYILSQQVTLRDAVHAAMNLDIFHRHAEKIAMANIAQTVNCLHSLFLADGDKFVRTPAYHVYEMYMPHLGARVIPCRIPEMKNGLMGSASIKGGRVTLTLANPSLDTSFDASVQLAGASAVEAGGRVLTDSDMRAANTFDAPERIKPAPLRVSVAGGKLAATIPPKSVASIGIRLAT